MYLKSLVLKGFKSFADRSVLVLEPGITAIVGPNGSGKSNISDAVLWVLGERSARNLRGQAMEDIVFSGSAARRAVSVAEVDLVLDNSDHTLPVDFDEVTITRRMYRSGESEYLVNGVVSRRLDVLDILHDTGLGTGTHSIISQGSLDSILQSRPEDRRALIEEAAGVLKHKQRKEKSARKLASMDNHLARVRDVVAEVERQLKPLERKAKRAEAYKTASADLAQRKLALAVDDLRSLQGQWGKVCADEQAAQGEVEARKHEVDAAEGKVGEYQELMRRDSLDAGELARKQRRASSLSERLDGAEVRIRERRRAAVGAQADLKAALEGHGARREAAVAELESASAQLEGVKASCGLADAEVATATAARDEADLARKQADQTTSNLAAQLKTCEKDLAAATRDHASLQAKLANGMAQVQLAETRKAELEAQLDEARAEDERAAAALEKAAEQLRDLEERESRAQADLVARFEERERSHSARDAAHEAERLIEAEMKAIEQAQMAASMNEPAMRWVMENAERLAGAATPVSKAFHVSQNLEAVVEALLGEDLSALAVEDGECALRIARALSGSGQAGDVSVVLRLDGARRAALAGECPHGTPLLRELTYSEDMAPVVEALLGDVVVCADRDAAFQAHAADASGLRFISRDGCAVWPNGKARFYGLAGAEGEGVIARERRLGELGVQRKAASEARASADTSAQRADDAYRQAQVESLKLSQQLASAQGAHAAARDQQQATARRLAAMEGDIAAASRQAQAANDEVGGLQPATDQAAEKVAQLTQTRADLTAEREQALLAAAPLGEQAARAAERLAEAKLEAARLTERLTYIQRIVMARERDIESLDASAVEQRISIAMKEVVMERGAAALALVDEIAASLSRRVRMLDEALAASESSSNSVHAQAAQARDEARRAHDGYDAASARMAQVRVEKSRLEVLVESAVAAIVDDLGVPLDHAQQLPLLEDRRQVEDEVFKLERRIKNMGAINPDAADEYRELKERYDYLAGQMSDMESARRALSRIVRVIDARMKDDFANTFEQVNVNFGEIFSLLFPGGTAHLSLDDPDDLENTGVEVTAQPRGKRLTKMMLMSGGEKSLTALALLFAVYKTRATPFYILDEVEAALDDTNLRRLIAYIDTLRAQTQLIMITHQRRTMEMADVLFGVSMQADGVTKVISQKLERALEHSE